MPEAWLDFINPVDVSTSPDANQGGIVGGPDCLRTDDGDASYVEVSNGYDQTEGGVYRDGGFSKTFAVDLVPDSSLPDESRLLSWDVRWVLTLRVLTPGTFCNVIRLTDFGFDAIGSTTSTAYLEDFPRSSKTNGPTWDQLRAGYTHTFRGLARNLFSSPFTLARITRMRLWVTWELRENPTMPPARLTQRADGRGPLGGPRRMDITWKSRQTGFRPGAVY